MSRKSNHRKQSGKTPLVGIKPPSGGQTLRRNARRSSRTIKRISSEHRKDILGITLAFFGLLSLMSLITGDEGGLFAIISQLLQQIAGYGAFLVPMFLLLAGIRMLFGGERHLSRISTERLWGLILLILNLFTWLHWIFGGGWELAKAGQGGGFIGAIFERLVTITMGDWGGFIVLVAWLLIALIWAFNISLPDLFQQVSTSIKKTKGLLSAKKDRFPPGELSYPEKKKNALATHLDEAAFVPFADDFTKKKVVLKESMSPIAVRKKEGQANVLDSIKPEAAPSAELQIRQKSFSSGLQPPRVQEILDPPTRIAYQSEVDRNRAKVIEETLESLGAPSKVVDIHHGPAITQFCLEPGLLDHRTGSQRVTVSKISNHAGDIALALSVRNVRLEIPVAGKSYIGIEVPNEELEPVSLREGIESKNFQRTQGELKFVLGKDVSGEFHCASLEDMPHLLIAGTTGSGKSVCMNSILTCLLLQYSPDELKLLMIDPKRVELANYNRIPHLLNPVIVDAEKAPAYLKWLLREMDRRLEEFNVRKVRDITEYNATQEEKMPFIVVAIDELSTLMMLAPIEIEATLNRLAEMARATGIHLIVATQRPSVKVITGKIKANFPARISFSVVSGTDSRVGIDKSGADHLVGKGDMLFHSPESGKPKRLQGAFISDHEIERIVEYWQKVAEEQKIRAQLKGEPLPLNGNAPIFSAQSQIPLNDLPGQNEDALLQKAIEVVRQEERASISLLQRKLSIGYMRAARMIENLERLGIVGKPEPSSGIRPVLDFGDDHPH